MEAHNSSPYNQTAPLLTASPLLLDRHSTTDKTLTQTAAMGINRWMLLHRYHARQPVCIFILSVNARALQRKALVACCRRKQARTFTVNVQASVYPRDKWHIFDHHHGMQLAIATPLVLTLSCVLLHCPTHSCTPVVMALSCYPPGRQFSCNGQWFEFSRRCLCKRSDRRYLQPSTYPSNTSRRDLFLTDSASTCEFASQH